MAEFSRIPIIKLWRLLVIPLQGEIDDRSAANLSADVLNRIHGSEVVGLIIDVTGLWLMDSHLCAVLTRLARAAELMGTRTVLCGLTAETAMTLQAMGLELEGFEAMLSLEQALEHYGVYSPWSGEQQSEDFDWLTEQDATALPTPRA
jgi:rsbT antagonist protein RsbS